MISAFLSPGNFVQKLVGGGIKNLTSLTVTDSQQDLEVTILVRHRAAEEWDEEANPDKFEVQGEIREASESLVAPEGMHSSASPPATSSAPPAAASDEAGDDIIALDDADDSPHQLNGKRQRESPTGGDSEPARKRSRQETEDQSSDVIEID